MECEERYEELLRVSRAITLNNSPQQWKEWLAAFVFAVVGLNPSKAVQNVLADDISRATDLFKVSFRSFWCASETGKTKSCIRDNIITCFETILSTAAPTAIAECLISLIEYMDLSGSALPVRLPIVACAAEKHELYAQALYFRELEFRESRSQPSSECVEALIAVNIKLGYLDSAKGLLRSSAASFVRLRPSWHETVENWQGALSSYSIRLLDDENNADWLAGRMRCLEALGEWNRLLSITSSSSSSDSLLKSKSRALACYNLQLWDALEGSLDDPPIPDFDQLVYRAILWIRKSGFSDARVLIQKAREDILSNKSNHPINKFVSSKEHQLDQLDEIIDLKISKSSAEEVREKFNQRLSQLEDSLEAWQRVVPLRSLLLNPVLEDIDVWIRYARLARKRSNLTMSDRILDRFLQILPHHPDLVVSRIKNVYAAGNKARACQMLEAFVEVEGKSPPPELLSKCSLLCALWLGSKDSSKGLNYLGMALVFNPENTRARNALALAKFRESQTKGFGPHVLEAVHALFQCIGCSPALSLPNVLRLLTLWFSFYGSTSDLESAFEDGFDSVPLKVWVQAIPQILARLRSRRSALRKSIQRLLSRIGSQYPQSVVFALTVASDDPVSSQISLGASKILESVHKAAPRLVEECRLVATELVRVSCTWTEKWAAALEEASRFYFVENNVGEMLKILTKTHRESLMDPTASSPSETCFLNEHGAELLEAWCWIQKYLDTLKEFYLEQAWGIYYSVFQRLHKKVSSPEIKSFTLSHVSPELSALNNCLMHVPGTSGAASVHSFVHTVEVMNSKQKPRVVHIVGSDGKRYQFLLKANEDLKQDERVMQLFGLINSIVASKSRSEQVPDVHLKTFAVVPLSSNAGLIEWVPGCNTLHALIKQIRDKHNVPLSLEHNLMRRIYSKYDELPLIDKVSVFQQALSLTSGDELRKSMWLSSSPLGAATWVKRRATFARSLAVTSMVGYILGLGDRHPSNLMIEELTGQVIHIDFGDCFDVAASRERFPEKVPFRLTRQLVNSLEASGVDGMFRITAERIMHLLKKNSDSIMAMLEAFVYDPLITWRLCRASGPTSDTETLSVHAKSVVDRVHSKLIGDGKSVSVHVDQLIEAAMAPENLCQCYVGWCPFW